MATPPFSIDITDPADSSIIANFPAKDRQLRDTLVSWFEHDHDLASGRHRIGMGEITARDAITDWVAGSLWILTGPSSTEDQPVVQVYTGTVWNDASASSCLFIWK